MIGTNKVSVSALKKGLTQKLDANAKAQIEGYMKYKVNKAEPGQFGGPPVDYDPSMTEYIPPEWGTNSTQMRVVEAGAANDFQLSIKGTK
jgi:hypothetical protein